MKKQITALLGRIVQDASLAQHEKNPLSNYVIFCAKLEICKQASRKPQASLSKGFSR